MNVLMRNRIDMANWPTIKVFLSTEPFELALSIPLRALTGLSAEIKKAGKIPEANPTKRIIKANPDNINRLSK